MVMLMLLATLEVVRIFESMEEILQPARPLK